MKPIFGNGSDQENILDEFSTFEEEMFNLGPIFHYVTNQGPVVSLAYVGVKFPIAGFMSPKQYVTPPFEIAILRKDVDIDIIVRLDTFDEAKFEARYQADLFGGVKTLIRKKGGA